MAKVNLNTLSSGYASIDFLNNNFIEIETAFDNTLSRDGSTPNQMEADLDMNSKHVLNLPAPVQQTEPLRLKDISDYDLDSLVEYDVIHVDSVAIMKSLGDLEIGQKVRTLGYYEPGDGGGNDYEIVAAGTGTDDGGSFIDLSGSGLQAKGLFGIDIKAEQFGISSSNTRTSNDSQIANAITYGASTRKPLIFGPDTYGFSSEVSIDELASLIGQGAQRTILDFEDTNGISSTVNSSSLNSYGRMQGFTIRGNADTSTNSAATLGLKISKANYWKTRDVIVQDFVHNIEFAGTDGFIQGFDVDISSFSTKYPNSVNGYPDTLFRTRDDSGGKPQAGSFSGIFYAQIITEQEDHVATSGQTDFVIDWSSTGSNKNFDLFKETGIKVGVKNSWGTYTKQVIGTDYDLYVEWSGVEYNIPAGTEYVRDYVRTQSGDSNAEARKIIVRFLAGRSNGDEIRIQWNDPTCNYCIKNDIGTGLKFDVQLGGGDVGFYSAAPDNECNIRYAQMCNNLFQLTADADFCSLDYTETQGGTIENYLLDSGNNTNWKRRKTRKLSKLPSDQTVTSTSDTEILSPVSFTIHNPVPRLVKFAAQYTLEATTSSARAEVTIQRSTTGSGGSWSDIHRILLEEVHGGTTSVKGSSSLQIMETENNIEQGFLGRKEIYYYRVVARVLNTDSTLTIQGGTGANESTLEISELQP